MKPIQGQVFRGKTPSTCSRTNTDSSNCTELQNIATTVNNNGLTSNVLHCTVSGSLSWRVFHSDKNATSTERNKMPFGGLDLISGGLGLCVHSLTACVCVCVVCFACLHAHLPVKGKASFWLPKLKPNPILTCWKTLSLNSAWQTGFYTLVSVSKECEYDLRCIKHNICYSNSSFFCVVSYTETSAFSELELPWILISWRLPIKHASSLLWDYRPTGFGLHCCVWSGTGAAGSDKKWGGRGFLLRGTWQWLNL